MSDGHLVAVIGYNRQMVKHACVVTVSVDGDSNLSHLQCLRTKLLVTVTMNFLHDAERFQLTTSFDCPLLAWESPCGTLWINTVLDDPECVTEVSM